jgi:hypothetical protein
MLYRKKNANYSYNQIKDRNAFCGHNLEFANVSTVDTRLKRSPASRIPNHKRRERVRFPHVKWSVRNHTEENKQDRHQSIKSKVRKRKNEMQKTRLLKQASNRTILVFPTVQLPRDDMADNKGVATMSVYKRRSLEFTKHWLTVASNIQRCIVEQLLITGTNMLQHW